MGRDVSHLPLLGAGRLGEGVQRDLEEEASGLTERKTCSRVLIGRLHVKAHEGHRSELQQGFPSRLSATTGALYTLSVS